MRSNYWILPLVLLGCTNAQVDSPIVEDTKKYVKYKGLYRNGIEAFLNIPYGKDTGGTNRFKPPVAVSPAPNTTIDARSAPLACPQPYGQWLPPLTLGNISSFSEDCLNLNVLRPMNTNSSAKLPVMVFIHGGSFWTGDTTEPTIMADGMILESVANGLPIIQVSMNYRLSFFGFAQSTALKAERSENAGLRDQRLAIEWVRDNIAAFGGDCNRITIFGQSSGGLAVGMQIMAYGGSKPAPFQQAICESQALEPGITGNFTIDAYQRVVNYVGCNTTDFQSSATVECLRNLDTYTLMNATIETYFGDITHNIGDIWLPVVDGDFLPGAPSDLIDSGRFNNITTMMGWCQDDVSFFSPFDIQTANDTKNYLSAYLPDMTNASIDGLLALYPVTDFRNAPEGNLTAEFYRFARIFRDVLMVCEPVYYGAALAAKGNPVYFYDFNQTMLEPILAKLYYPDLGVVHTSEFAYIFGNLSHYNVSDYPFDPSPSDYALRDRASRTWTTFASLGHPSQSGKNTVQGWISAFTITNETDLMVVGGPYEGLSSFDGARSSPVIAAQKLRERCGFINRPDIMKQLNF